MSDAIDLATRIRGKFIVFDGPDGAGKSTQRGRLADAIQSAGGDVVCCRDPGGTAVGERIRSVLLDHDLSGMDVNCETMLFMASRAQLVAEVIRPALRDGKTVLCDRFVTSTCAYQGAAGYDPRRVIDLARFSINDCWPDLTLLIDVPVEDGFVRIGRKAHHAGKNRDPKLGDLLIPGSQPDAMEARSVEYHRRVRTMFLDTPTYYPTPVAVVDGRGDEDEVFRRVLDAVKGWSGAGH